MTTALMNTVSSSVSSNWLNNLLLRICIQLQLTKTQHQAAEEHYLSVAEWLGASGSPIAILQPAIYPQGSLRIGTTVRPWLHEEYDLDLVLWLALYHTANPLDILNLVEGRLRDHRTYAPMVERKNRCIRLNFAKQFHLDILPARPDIRFNSTHVLVPDRAASDWKESNPKGYAEWFERQGALQLREAKRAAVEDLPAPEGAEEKNALQLAVQLLKRWRDIRFVDSPRLAPISIVLTTLAGHHYTGEPDPLQALRSIVQRINLSIPTGGRLVVANPANPYEDLSERWDADHEAYLAFVSAMNALEQDLLELQYPGVPSAAKLLTKLFGETAQQAIRSQTEAIEKARASNALGVAPTGAITVLTSRAASPVRRNTFYGD
jgi:Second Messenger Oligonucleotide or Dinucleotide Synthetase domain